MLAACPLGRGLIGFCLHHGSDEESEPHVFFLSYVFDFVFFHLRYSFGLR